jgi:hypothetical protein
MQCSYSYSCHVVHGSYPEPDKSSLHISMLLLHGERPYYPLIFDLQVTSHIFFFSPLRGNGPHSSHLHLFDRPINM